MSCAHKQKHKHMSNENNHKQCAHTKQDMNTTMRKMYRLRVHTKHDDMKVCGRCKHKTACNKEHDNTRASGRGRPLKGEHRTQREHLTLNTRQKHHTTTQDRKGSNDRDKEGSEAKSVPEGHPKSLEGPETRQMIREG